MRPSAALHVDRPTSCCTAGTRMANQSTTSSAWSASIPGPRRQSSSHSSSPFGGRNWRDSSSELLLCPLLRAHLMVEPGEDPPEQAEARLLAPTVGVARACVEARCFLRSGDEAENDIADGEREKSPLHGAEVWAPKLSSVNGPGGWGASETIDVHGIARLRRQVRPPGPRAPRRV